MHPSRVLDGERNSLLIIGDIQNNPILAIRTSKYSICDNLHAVLVVTNSKSPGKFNLQFTYLLLRHTIFICQQK